MEKESSVQHQDILKWCLRNPVELLGGLMILLLTIVVFLQVFYRYALHSPLAWSEEFAMFLWQWCNYIGAALAVRHGHHYHVDLVVAKFPERWRNLMQVFSSLIIFTVAYIFLHHGIKMTIMTMDQLYPVLNFPLAYAYVVMPICGALIILYNIKIFIRQVRALITR